jgi:hypothetical protein
MVNCELFLNIQKLDNEHIVEVHSEVFIPLLNNNDDRVNYSSIATGRCR